MRQLVTIAVNAFMELVRQPVFLLLMSVSASFIVFLAAVPYFGFGDDPKLVKDSTLAIMLLSGLFGAIISASSSVAHEIRTGTALAVLSKPVGRAQFLLAKYFGLAAALTLLTYVNLVATLLASRMAFDAYGDADLIGLAIFFGALVLAYALAGFTNYFLRRTFMSDAVIFTVVMLTVAFLVINCFDKEGKWQAFAAGVDWRMVPVSLLILFALWILAALALACSTRFEIVPTLTVCSALFLLGLMSDYLFGRRADAGSWWATVCYTVIPNWQLFWLADALEPGKEIPWVYVAKAGAYLVAYLVAALSLALVMFEDRELK